MSFFTHDEERYGYLGMKIEDGEMFGYERYPNRVQFTKYLPAAAKAMSLEEIAKMDRWPVNWRELIQSVRAKLAE